MYSRFLAIVASLALVLAPDVGMAQNWPTKPIRIILPFAAGGGGDTMMRPFAPRLSEALGTPVVLENMPGASGILGVKQALSAPMDDHTFLMISDSHAVVETLFPARGYEIMRDFVPVAGLAIVPFVFVVNPKLPVKDLAEFVDYARKNPGKINYASPGTGSIYHLVTEKFSQDLKLSLVHVPYKSSTVARQDLMGGQVDAMFDTVSTVKPLLEAGRVRGLGVATPQTNAQVPNLPPIASVVPGFQESSWLGFMAKSRTSPAVVKRLQDEILKLVQSEAGRKVIADLGGIPMPLDAAALGGLLRSDTQKWAQIIKAGNIKAE